MPQICCAYSRIVRSDEKAPMPATFAIAREARVKTLCLYHHAPMRSDEAQDAILMAARWSAKSHGDGFNVIAAHEGLELTLGDDDPAAVVTP